MQNGQNAQKFTNAQNAFYFELIDEQNLQGVINFLAPVEACCVSLMSNFVQDGVAHLARGSGFAIFYAPTKTLWGVIFITISGKCLFYFDDAKSLLLQKNLQAQKNARDFAYLVKPILCANPISCILGEECGAKLLRALYPEDCTDWREYILMEYAGANMQVANNLPAQLTLRRCTLADKDALYPLQKEYEIVEVLSKGEVHNALTCKSALRLTLQTQTVYALFCGDVAVAKAGTNALGLNYVQIGGVFTDAKWRGRGLAQFLVKSVVQDALCKGKGASLFVKTHNQSAKSAYLKAGFVPKMPYVIAYY